MENNELQVTSGTELNNVSQAREIQEVQGALVIAQKFKRDMTSAFSDIIASCRRYSLADKALYSYPRGGEMVSGPSIRLAEVLAQNYGNMSFGVRELERRNGVSICEAFCWDMQKNTRVSKTFSVALEIRLKNGSIKKLTDPRDIYEHIANMGARRMRSCILGLVPPDIVEAAVDECRSTLKKGNGETMEDRVRKMVVAFEGVGVSKEMLELRLKHGIELTTPDEIVELLTIFTSLRDKQSKRSDFFEFEDDKESVASALKAKMEEQK